MADLTGKTVGNYRILEKIGRGGMATVYKAYQPALERNVAIKVIHEMLAADDEQFLKRFHREAKAVAAIRHPNIVQVFDFGTEGDQSYMVMEYLEGITLKEELRTLADKGETMRWPEVERIFRAVASAVEHAHSQGMVHRDLKPANIMLTYKGDVILTDFGIARIVGGTQYTATGMIAGTPAYMSPEQGQGERGNAQSDIYALGVILYEMLTGRVPFEADTPWAVIVKHISDPLPLPRQINPEIPEEVEQVILKALAKDPSDRFQSAADFVKALDGSMVGETRRIDPAATLSETAATEVTVPTPAVPAKVAEPAPVVAPDTVQAHSSPARPARIPPWLWLVGGILLGGLLVTAAILFTKETEESAPTTAVAAAPNEPTSTRSVAPTSTPLPATSPKAGETTPIIAAAATTEPTATATIVPTATPRPSPTPLPEPTLPVPPSEGKMLFTCEGRLLQICAFDYQTGQMEPIGERMDFNMYGGAAWSPDAYQIVFSAAPTESDPQKLYIINADGTELRQLTFRDSYDHEASWSPDGLWISFHRNCALWLIRPDGTDAHQIMASEEFCVEVPTFSPDGQKLAFLSHGPEGFLGIWVVNRDGSDPREVFTFRQPVSAGGWVGWSGDGQQLSSWFDDDDLQGILINADGSGRPRIIPGPFDWWHVSFWPRWGHTDFSKMRMVSINFGAVDREYGLAHVWSDGGDGLTGKATVGDETVLVTLPNETMARYVYFDVNNDFLFAQESHVLIGVDYYDLGYSSFDLNYDSADRQFINEGRFKNTELVVQLENSEQWKTATFELTDAFFGNRQHVGAADFRLAVGDNDVYIRRVTVTLP